MIRAACFAAALAAGTGQAAVIEADLQQATKSGGDVAFIVQFADGVDLNAFPGQGQGKGTQLVALLWALRNQANASQSAAIELLQAGGAKKIIQLWSINALAATASPDVLQDLADLPEVESIKLDTTLAAPSPQLATASTREGNLDAIRATELWDAGYDGAGVVVANVDTGRLTSTILISPLPGAAAPTAGSIRTESIRTPTTIPAMAPRP